MNIDILKTKKIVLFIVGSLLFIILIIIVAVNKNNTKNYGNLKQDKTKYLVYTKYEDKSSVYQKEIPYINMKADVIKKVNHDIYLFCDDYKDKEKSVISYEYDINGIILSVVLKIVDNETEYAPEVYFKTYNINLDTSEVISDDSLLGLFEVDETTVYNKIDIGFRNFYKDVTDKGYVDSLECDYNCFLSYRGIDNYLDDVFYYVENGSLVVFRSFIFYSVFGEEKYFSDDDFKFVIAKFKD